MKHSYSISKIPKSEFSHTLSQAIEYLNSSSLLIHETLSFLTILDFLTKERLHSFTVTRDDKEIYTSEPVYKWKSDVSFHTNDIKLFFNFANTYITKFAEIKQYYTE